MFLYGAQSARERESVTSAARQMRPPKPDRLAECVQTGSSTMDDLRNCNVRQAEGGIELSCSRRGRTLSGSDAIRPRAL
jgi:hypothetical protein